MAAATDFFPKVNMTTQPLSALDAIPAAAALLTEIALRKPPESAITAKTWKIVRDLDPKCPEAHNGLAVYAQRHGDWSTALLSFDMAAAISKTAPLCLNMSIAWDQMGNLPMAIAWCEEAIQKDPQFAVAYGHLYTLYDQLGDLAAARQVLNSGLALCPNAPEIRFALAELDLKEGRLDEGWQGYEFRGPHMELLRQMDEHQEWTGQSLEGKSILVVREQGFGDEIMFGPYIPLLKELGAERVVHYTYPDLARLMAQIPGVDLQITHDQEIGDIDYWVGTGSLALQCNVWRSPCYPNPEDGVYLHGADDAARFAGLIPETGNLRVGLAWKGNPKHARDRFRSIPFEALRPLLATSGCDFYSLQQGDAESGLVNLTEYAHDVADTAAAISNLDLVITCDSMVAHLAGAMGKPVWILLGTPGDWRWGLGGSRSAWYPSARLFRADAPRDWEGVISSVETALGPEIAALSARRRSLNVLVSPMESTRVDGSTTLSPAATVGADAPDPARPTHTASSITASAVCRYGCMTWLRNDHYIGRALELYGEYSQSEADLLAKVLKPGDVVIEAGANVGGLTLHMIQAVGPTGCVHAFEPQPEYYDLLRKNLPLKAVLSPDDPKRRSSHCYDEALGAEDGEIELQAVPTSSVHAPGWKATGEVIKVGQVTIDHIVFNCLDSDCDLIKIDVDGQEHDILIGAEQTIQRCRPLLYVEYDKPSEYPDLIPWIEAHDYRIYQHDAPLFNPNNFRGNPINVFGPIVSRMLLCIPNERKVRPGEWGISGLSRLRVKR